MPWYPDKSIQNDAAYLAPHVNVLSERLAGTAKKHWFDITEFGAVKNANSSDAIQSAIDSAQSGDVVFIPNGIFILDKTIILKSGTKLVGSASSAVLKMKDGANLSQMLYLPPNVNGHNYGIEISNLQIVGNKENNATGGHGIFLNSTYKAFIQDVKVVDMKGKGIYFAGSNQTETNTNYVKDCWVYACDEEGIFFNEYCSDMHIYGGDYGFNKLDNIKLSSPSSSVRNSTIWGSREGSGLNITTFAPSVQVMGNQIEGNAKHGVEIHSSHVFVEGNKIYDNSEYGNAGIYSGIYISHPSTVLVNITLNNNFIYSGLYLGTGVHKHAIEFADSNHKNATLFGNSMKYTGNGVIDLTRDIVKGLLIASDTSDFSWINTFFNTYIGTDQTVSGAGWVKLKFNTVARDIEGEFDTLNNKFIVKHTGYFQFDTSVMFQNQVDGNLMMMEFWINDGTTKYRVNASKTGGNGWHIVSGTLLTSLAKGDTISVYVYTETQATTFSGGAFTRFTGKVIR